jgi:hypothetical protein
MPQTETSFSSTADQTGFDYLLGEIEAAAEDASLLAFSMAIEAARPGPSERESVLVAQAMGELSMRASQFSTHMRKRRPARKDRKELAHLHRVSVTVAEILQDAARLAADDLEGLAADELTHKDSTRLVEQIQARVRDLDAVLDTARLSEAP